MGEEFNFTNEIQFYRLFGQYRAYTTLLGKISYIVL